MLNQKFAAYLLAGNDGLGVASLAQGAVHLERSGLRRSCTVSGDTSAVHLRRFGG